MRLKYFLKLFLTLAILFLPLYFFRDDYSESWKRLEFYFFYKPCQEPIEYSLGGFDNRFGLDKSEFIKAVDESVDLWETASGRDLFVFSEMSQLKINLVYDQRQDTTNKLSDINEDLKVDRASYDELKKVYGELLAVYNKKTANLNLLVDSYNQSSKNYQTEVKKWNSQGGAPADVYQKMMAEKARLEGEVEKIKSAQISANQTVEEVNSAAYKLNNLAAKLNLNVEKYNAIGESVEPEFVQGNYSGGPETAEINIYQFNDYRKLVRVLTHELGHALGIDHIANPEDIMYALNVGVNDKITVADLDALNKICATPNRWESYLAKLKYFFTIK